METLPTEQAILGESPLWHRSEQVFYWVDILGRKVFRFDPVENRNDVVFSGLEVTALAETDDGLLMVTSTGLHALRGPGAEQSVTAIVELSVPDGVRTNDGKCDPRGRLWFGTMDLETTRPIGALYTSDGRTVTMVREEIILSNGIGWSPGGDVFYHIDSIRRRLHRYDYDLVAGVISGGTTLVDMSGVAELPDGLAVDAEGNIWVAMWDGWRLDVYEDTGTRVHQVPLEVQKPTSVAFGGPALSDLYVTTASQDLDAEELAGQPDAGRVLRIDPGVTGVPVGVFAPPG